MNQDKKANFSVKNGIYNLDFRLSKLEKILLDEFSLRLEDIGFQYLSIPTSIDWETLSRQDVINLNETHYIVKVHCLAGSAEQGILEYFKDSEVPPLKIYAKNQCFRKEKEYRDLIHLKEFTKIEQYCFCNEDDWEENFDLILNNAEEFLIDYGVTYRVINVTTQDPGYHLKKYDIEIYSKIHGWVETHSCSYFGEEQTKRFGITGATHTISNTGIATPRILIPFTENEELLKEALGEF